MVVMRVLIDRGAAMSSNASCMEVWGVLGKAVAMSSRHTMTLSVADKHVIKLYCLFSGCAAFVVAILAR